ncbi:MAG: PD-(D/E)XK nuclease family protein [Thermoleophilia bacterium]|nr:PD-(D/E)XK nuclease family protein [Thermoleophilia bacterium]
MSLTIIKGPPNSGRTEVVRREYVDLLPRRPILVVPGVDDIFDWESRLARGDGAFLGCRIVHFKDLVSEVLGRDPGSRPRVATSLERRHLVTLAFNEAWPNLKARIARQPGLVDAMLRLIDEFRQDLLDPTTIEENAIEINSGYLANIIAVYRHYLSGLDERGLTDNPALAVEATKSNLSGWQGRPVFVAGIDDLTGQQLELLVKLAAETEVTIALTHEQNNPSMAVTENLLQRLEARGATVKQTTDRDGVEEDREHQQVLLDVERDFQRQDKPRSLDPDAGAVTVMHSSGLRGEAEGVAARIARLVADEVKPDEIAIAISSPASEGKRFRDALREYDIPVTLESETPAPETAIGRSVLTLLGAASGAGTAADFIRYLRGPSGVDPDLIDQLEYRVVRAATETAREAAAIYRSLDGESPPGWDELTGLKPNESAASAARVACDQLAGNILAADSSALPGDSTVIEVQMTKAIGRACEELESIGGSASPAEITEALRSGAIMTWAIPTQGTVRIASPYSLRAKRFEHLFIVSLQESSLTGADRSGPFLNSDARKEIGLAEFVDPELQELYLFYSCLSVPTDGLWLSSRVADESGKAEHPSPLVSDVERLFPEGSLRRHGRSAEQIVFPVSEAPSRSELARSLASAPDPVATLKDNVLATDEVDVTALGCRLSLAAVTEQGTRTLGSLRHELSLKALSEDLVFSATSLEAFRTCQYKWFIERALNPQRFGPEPEAMARGSLVHAVLKEIYDQGDNKLPNGKTVEDWVAKVEPAVELLAKDEKYGLGSDSAPHRIVRFKAVEAIVAYLRREAERDSAFKPSETEAGFGFDGDPIDMGGWSLHGSIDRIDTMGNQAVIFDYKTGGGVLSRSDIVKQKRLQLQLYMAAIEKRKPPLTPVAALYVPIHNGEKVRPRGFGDPESKGDLKDLNFYAPDFKVAVRVAIDAAKADATAAVAEIRAGNIDHDPLTCVEHFKHAAVPDWAPDEKAGEDQGSDG